MLNSDKLTIWKWYEYTNILENFLEHMSLYESTRAKSEKTAINYDLKIVMKIVHAAGRFKINPTLGNCNPFDNIFTWDSGIISPAHDDNWIVIEDSIEQSLGWLNRHKWRSYRNTINPLYWLWRWHRFICRKLNEFLNNSLGFNKNTSKLLSELGSICSIVGIPLAIILWLF